MSRRQAAFTQADVERAIRAARAQGLEIGAVEVEGGIVRIVPADRIRQPAPAQKAGRGLSVVP